MTSYLIYPTEQEALARSHEAHEADTLIKSGKTGLDPAEYTTQYRWAIDVGADGQTALVIDSDEQLLTPDETAALVPSLPDAEGENWFKPPPEMPAA